MTDAADIEIIRAILQAAGLDVERIPVATEQRCDLWGRDAAYQYLIEVKGLHNDESIGAALRTRGEYSRARPTQHARSVDDAIRDAVRQIEATPSQSDSVLRFIALIDRSTHGHGVSATKQLPVCKS